jgi:hypothetical protein
MNAVYTVEAGMTDTAIKNAMARRDELHAEIAEYERAMKNARAEAERVETFIAGWAEFADEESKRAVGIFGGGRDTARPPKKPVNPKKEDVVSVAELILLSRGHPMGRSDLFHALGEHGIHLHGKDPEMVLSTMLWRMQDKIVRIHPYGYWVRNMPCPSVGYDPEKGLVNTPYED